MSNWFVCFLCLALILYVSTHVHATLFSFPRFSPIKLRILISFLGRALAHVATGICWVLYDISTREREIGKNIEQQLQTTNNKYLVISLNLLKDKSTIFMRSLCYVSFSCSSLTAAHSQHKIFANISIIWRECFREIKFIDIDISPEREESKIIHKKSNETRNLPNSPRWSREYAENDRCVHHILASIYRWIDWTWFFSEKSNVPECTACSTRL